MGSIHRQNIGNNSLLTASLHISLRIIQKYDNHPVQGESITYRGCKYITYGVILWEIGNLGSWPD